MADDTTRSKWVRTVASLLRRPSVKNAPHLVCYIGGCHCKRVRFEVRAPSRLTLLECNCSICSMSAYLHLVVPVSEFRLISGEEVLATYRFQTMTAEHAFCSVCGIKSFYVPRMDALSRSVNARCLDSGPGVDPIVMQFDGARWDGVGRRL